MSELQQLTEEQIKKTHEIAGYISEAIKILTRYNLRAAMIAIDRLEEGIMWAQQAILHEAKESKSLD